MGGRSGKTRQRNKGPDPKRVIAGIKGAKTRKKNEKEKKKKRARARGQTKQFTVGISKVASSNLAAEARKTNTTADKIIENLLLTDTLSVKFKRREKRPFIISTEAKKKLDETAARYQVSLEEVIERYLRSLF